MVINRVENPLDSNMTKYCTKFSVVGCVSAAMSPKTLSPPLNLVLVCRPVQDAAALYQDGCVPVERICRTLR